MPDNLLPSGRQVNQAQTFFILKYRWIFTTPDNESFLVFGYSNLNFAFMMMLGVKQLSLENH